MLDQSGQSDAPAAVSVVVCAYTNERWDLLKRAVSSLDDQSLPALEVILVIDHNEELRQAAVDAFPGVRVLANCEIRGLSGARNTGWKVATGEIVAFLDDDAFAAPDWLSCLTRPYDDPCVAGVGGAIVPEWSTGEPDFLPEEFWWVIGCTYRGVREASGPIRNMLGANMSLRRNAIERAGGFDIRLGRVGDRPVGCEETELCIRVQALDPQSVILYEPRAIVHHHVSPARATWSYFRSRCFAEGLSKAHVAQVVGSNRALSTERSYVVRTLPTGFGRGVTRCIRTRDPSAALKPVGILVGLACTGAGFAAGWLKRPRPDTRQNPIRPTTEDQT